jgi:hypothetical protein
MGKRRSDAFNSAHVQAEIEFVFFSDQQQATLELMTKKKPIRWLD